MSSYIFNYGWPYNFPPYETGKKLNNRFRITESARHALLALPREDAILLLTTLLSRDGNPTFNGVDAARFSGRPRLHRLRVGRYRLVYRCDPDELSVDDDDVVTLSAIVDDRLRYMVRHQQRGLAQ